MSVTVAMSETWTVLHQAWSESQWSVSINRRLLLLKASQMTSLSLSKTAHRLIMHVTPSNCCSAKFSTSFFLSYSAKQLLSPAISLPSYALSAGSESLNAYKLLSLTYKVLATTQPPYLHKPISTQRPRSTRSLSVVTLTRFCTAHKCDQQTYTGRDHATPSVAIDRIYRCYACDATQKQRKNLAVANWVLAQSPRPPTLSDQYQILHGNSLSG